MKVNKILFLPTDRYVPGVLGEVKKMLRELETKAHYRGGMKFI